MVKNFQFSIHFSSPSLLAMTALSVVQLSTPTRMHNAILLIDTSIMFDTIMLLRQ